MIIIIGTKLICSKLSEQMPIIKPKRLNDIHDNKSISNIRKGYSSLISTKKVDVIKIRIPRKKDFVVAAPTKPITISTYEIGADKNSYVVPRNFGKKFQRMHLLHFAWKQLIKLNQEL